jgi:hypothetical protein
LRRNPSILLDHDFLFSRPRSESAYGGNFYHQVFAARQELVQRWIQRTDGDRQAVHGFGTPREVLSLKGNNSLSAARRAFLRLLFDFIAAGSSKNHESAACASQNHVPHVLDLLPKEHVLRAAEPDSFRSKRTRLNRIARNVGIRPTPHLAERLRPAHEFSQVRDRPALGAGIVFSFPLITRPVVPSSEIQSPSLKTLPFTRISRLFR